MKKKDIITLIISSIVFLVAGYFALSMLGIIGGNKATPTTNSQEQKQAQAQQEFTGNIDEDTLQKVDKLSDYGEATLDNIGRANPFGPL